MKSSQLKWALVALPLCLALSASVATAQTIFSEDFEGTLSQWTGKSGGGHHGVITVDPLRAGNKVLTFNGLGSGGDMFSILAIPVVPAQTYILKFEYLGTPGAGGVAGNLGGVIGFSENLVPNKHRWLEGTVLCCGIEADNLADSDAWETHSVSFDPFKNSVGNPWTIAGNDIHIILEDFIGSGGLAGDVYFDNIRLFPSSVDVQIDIKPGSYPNSINLGARGKIPVAILSSANFDAPAVVDPGTLQLAGMSVNMIGKKNPDFQCSSEDVNSDGLEDLVCHFENLLELSVGDTTATLLGETINGVAISGTDDVRIVPDP